MDVVTRARKGIFLVNQNPIEIEGVKNSEMLRMALEAKTGKNVDIFSFSKLMNNICEKIKVDAEYRWFLGIPFGKDTPHFSTFSKNYERRFKDSDIFETIFINIVNQAIKHNLVDGTTFYTDSTHKKANANKGKYSDNIEQVAKKRREWLEEEINEERRKHNKKEFK